MFLTSPDTVLKILHFRNYTTISTIFFQLCGRCFGRQNHLKRHVEGVHKNAILTNCNIVSTDADGTTIVKFESYPKPVKRRRTAPTFSTPKLENIVEDEESTTTIVVPSNAMTSTNSYKSISIIASASDTAGLASLVNLGNFETASTSLEPQSIIVENIDLDALTPAFVTNSGHQLIN